MNMTTLQKKNRTFHELLNAHIRVWNARLEMALDMNGEEGITEDDVIAVQTAVHELRKLIGGTEDDLERKITEWEMLRSQYRDTGAKASVADASMVLLALISFTTARKAQL